MNLPELENFRQRRRLIEKARHYSALRTPDFPLLAKSFGIPLETVTRVEDFDAALARALTLEGPAIVEVDMVAIGPFAESFAGPPAGAAGGAR